MSWHQLKAKYASTCNECKKHFDPGTMIFWDDSSRNVKHVKCKSQIKSNFYKPSLLKLSSPLGSYLTRSFRQNFDPNHKQIKNYVPKDDSFFIEDATMNIKSSEFELRKQAREFQRDLNGQ